MVMPSKAALLSILVCLPACVPLSPNQGFEEVRASVKERGVGTDIIWSYDGTHHAGIKQRTEAILTKPLTSESGVELALLNNSALQASFEELGVARAELLQASLIPNPVFGAELKFRNAEPLKVELSLVQQITRLIYRPLQLKIGEEAFEAAKLRAARSVIEFAGRAREAFFANLKDTLEVELLKRTLAAQEAASELSDRMYAAGNTTLLQRDTERALMQEAKLQLAQAEMHEALSREEVNGLLGLWGGQTNWKPNLDVSEVPAVAIARDGVEARAIKQSLDLEIAKAELKVASVEYQLARPFSLYPDAAAGGIAERDDGLWFGGPTLEIPLPLFDQGIAARLLAESTMRQKSRAVHDLSVRIRAQSRALYARAESARQRARFIKQNLLPLRQSIVNETQKEFNAMLIGAFDLLRSKREEIETGVEYIDSLHEYWSSKNKFEQLLSGVLIEEELEERDSKSRGRESSEGH